MCFPLYWVSIYGSGITGSLGNSVFNLWRNPRLFSQWLHHYTFPLEVYEGFSSTSSPTPAIVSFIHATMKWDLIMDLLMTTDIEHFFHEPLTICISHLHPFSWLFVLFIVHCKSSFYIPVRTYFNLFKITVFISHMYTHIRGAMCLNPKNTIDEFITR